MLFIINLKKEIKINKIFYIFKKIRREINEKGISRIIMVTYDSPTFSIAKTAIIKMNRSSWTKSDILNLLYKKMNFEIGAAIHIHRIDYLGQVDFLEDN